ncbi:hypothetical protein EVAR_55164_1 [Eumeta japonica]|uniref:Uncharacterized protein n=1 Tax=Eumeta variegata TaxID=151549 RepID=A0A4C1Y792_EUMVA|nr:hypothetical protein EVAR_55164_1 [Eumeta japonica]
MVPSCLGGDCMDQLGTAFHLNKFNLPFSSGFTSISLLTASKQVKPSVSDCYWKQLPSHLRQRSLAAFNQHWFSVHIGYRTPRPISVALHHTPTDPIPFAPENKSTPTRLKGDFCTKREDLPRTEVCIRMYVGIDAAFAPVGLLMAVPGPRSIRFGSRSVNNTKRCISLQRATYFTDINDFQNRLPDLSSEALKVDVAKRTGSITHPPLDLNVGSSTPVSTTTPLSLCNHDRLVDLISA